MICKEKINNIISNLDPKTKIFQLFLGCIFFLEKGEYVKYNEGDKTLRTIYSEAFARFDVILGINDGREGDLLRNDFCDLVFSPKYKLLNVYDDDGKEVLIPNNISNRDQFWDWDNTNKFNYMIDPNCYCALKQQAYDILTKNKIIISMDDIDFLSTNFLNDFIKWLKTSENLIFLNLDVINFYLSLKTKPFVLLMGLSGTGKTKLAQKFAEYITSDAGVIKREYIEFIPVQANWNDSTDLIGNFNPITALYQSTPLINLIIKAIKWCKEAQLNEPDSLVAWPYFLILDEMNLSKVEYYFSDILSIMETKDAKDGWSTENIKLHDFSYCITTQLIEDKNICPNLDQCPIFKSNDKNYRNFKKCEINFQHINPEKGKIIYIIPPEIPLPPNLYTIGTVNIDETTYMFSPKVLDRANSIEFSSVDIDLFFDNIDSVSLTNPINEKAVEKMRNDFTSDYTITNKLGYDFKTIRDKYMKFQKLFNEIQEIIRLGIEVNNKFEFGYRVISEILKYLLNGLNFYQYLVKDDCNQDFIKKIILDDEKSRDSVANNEETSEAGLEATPEDLTEVDLTSEVNEDSEPVNDTQLLNFLNILFDLQIKQKILPKFHGSAEELSETLKNLKKLCEINDLKYSLKKINKMLKDLESGYTSFM